MDEEKLAHSVAQAVRDTPRQQEAAAAAARVIREAGSFRWVGVYEVTATEIGLLAWAGSGPPAHPRFPRDQGLNGAAVGARETVVCDDVTQDPRYLTAFGSTRSEIVVPVTDPTGAVVGTIDVESEQTAAFDPTDRHVLEDCASAAAPLWSQPPDSS